MRTRHGRNQTFFVRMSTGAPISSFADDVPRTGGREARGGRSPRLAAPARQHVLCARGWLAGCERAPLR